MEAPIQALLRSIPDAWGPKCSLAGGGLARTRAAPNEITLSASAHVVLVMLTPQPRREVALGSDRKTISLAPVGALEIVPAGVDLFARWITAKENMLFALDHRRLVDHAEAEFDNQIFEIRPPKVGLVDRQALFLAQMARAELKLGVAASDLCLDSLVTLLSTHVLRSYSSLSARPTPRHIGGLSPKTWTVVNDYIQGHLADRLSVAALAQIAGLSPSHFLRAFQKTIGQTPHRYIIGQRLDHAERLISTGELSLAAIAASAGFSSNGHMTATMKRSRGYTPTEFRNETQPGEEWRSR